MLASDKEAKEGNGSLHWLLWSFYAWFHIDCIECARHLWTWIWVSNFLLYFYLN